MVIPRKSESNESRKNAMLRGPFSSGSISARPNGPYDVRQRWYDKFENLSIPRPKTDSVGHEVPEVLLKDNKPTKGETRTTKDRLAGRQTSHSWTPR
ncbi:MAG: hypothetical protein P8L85_21845 [Rubripirellula sp.]|nr:hypothetical protein [Rubripirellula sp.]